MPEDFWRTEDSEGAIIAFEMEAGSPLLPRPKDLNGDNLHSKI